MKTLFIILMAASFQLMTVMSFSQITGNNEVKQPMNPAETVLYGTDVVIQPNSSEDQSGVRISCASNGWLYASYMISSGGFRISKSVDGGLTWTYSNTLRANLYLTGIDLVVTGTDAGSIKAWVVNAGFTKSNIDIWELSVEELNSDLALAGSTLLDQILSNSGYPGVAIASDCKYPSAGSNPFSIGVLYSKAGNARDSIIFRSSGDGGVTFDNHKAVAAMQSYLGGKVALAFGRSQSHPEGRYFAAWCEAPYWDPAGQIFTSCTDASFNSTWTIPFRVDLIPQNAANTSKNPVIACQANNTDNGSTEFTTMILFDRHDLSTGKQGVVGVYNTSPLSSNNWNATLVSDPANSLDFQPDVTFNPENNNFYATWCDSTSQSLKCSYQAVDVPAPDAWSSFATSYNDMPNLLAPYPRIAINSAAGQVVHVWTGQVSGIIGNATFDGGDLYVSTPELSAASESLEVRIFPNPCQSYATISFQLKESASISLVVYNLNGQRLMTLPETRLSEGKQTIQLKVDDLDAGSYIFKLATGSRNYNGRFEIIR